MMGGDGGLNHAILGLSKIVDLENFDFVTLPFGSGNDTSRCFNWGGMPYDNHLSQLS